METKRYFVNHTLKTKFGSYKVFGKPECLICGNKLILDIHHLYRYKKRKLNKKEIKYYKSYFNKIKDHWPLDYKKVKRRRIFRLLFSEGIDPNKWIIQKEGGVDKLVFLCPNHHRMFHRLVDSFASPYFTIYSIGEWWDVKKLRTKIKEIEKDNKAYYEKGEKNYIKPENMPRNYRCSIGRTDFENKRKKTENQSQIYQPEMVTHWIFDKKENKFVKVKKPAEENNNLGCMNNSTKFKNSNCILFTSVYNTKNSIFLRKEETLPEDFKEKIPKCVICDYYIVLDPHHVHKDKKIVFFCPNHHYMVHRHLGDKNGTKLTLKEIKEGIAQVEKEKKSYYKEVSYKEYLSTKYKRLRGKFI